MQILFLCVYIGFYVCADACGHVDMQGTYMKNRGPHWSSCVCVCVLACVYVCADVCGHEGMCMNNRGPHWSSCLAALHPTEPGSLSEPGTHQVS